MLSFIATALNKDTLLIALVASLATGMPALLYQIRRGRTMGPQEEKDLISRAADQTLKAASGALDIAAEEREKLHQRIAAIEGSRRTDRERIGELENRVSGLQQVEIELRSEIASLQSRLENFDIEMFATLVVDGRRGLILNANHAMHEMTGHAELIGRPLAVLVPPDVRDKHGWDVEHYMENPEVRPMGVDREVRIRHADGHDIRAWIGLSPMPSSRHIAVAVVPIGERLPEGEQRH